MAALLMALAPSLSRMIASASPQLLAGLTELCTASGLKQVELSKLAFSTSEENATMPAGDHAGAACPYCVLPPLITTALLILAAWLFPGPRSKRAPPSYRLPQVSGPPLRGLGSRGPPLTR